MTFDEWRSKGRRIEIDGRNIFVHCAGEGPWLTCLHGFPTSSFDWSELAPELARKFKVLVFDFTGFGDSDKPRGYPYGTFERSDLVLALWDHFQIRKTFLVAHDFALSVVMELLERGHGSRIERAVFLNGGVFSELHRALTIQKLLLHPLLGPLVSRFINEKSFARQFRSVFSRAPEPAAIREHWHSIANRDGLRNYHKLIGYIRERRENKARWEKHAGLLPFPTRLVWGMSDPISGRHMSDEWKKRASSLDVVEVPDCGHYPQLEKPELVRRAILEFF